MKCSVLTLIKGRRQQFTNLCRFLERQSNHPDELVVAVMDEDPLPETSHLPFPVIFVRIQSQQLPLSKARNTAANTATYENLVFLDVDCLPSKTLVETYQGLLNDNPKICLMGEVFYLPEIPQEELEKQEAETRLDQIGEPHPAKPPFPSDGLVSEPDHGELWGLSFSLTKTSFEKAGGFDERYLGYGGEETDFARRLALAGIPLARCAKARAYHQHHSVSIPPLQHFDSIVSNAILFHKLWSYWPMTYWLAQFAQLGLIRWQEDNDILHVLRHPSNKEKEDAIQPSKVRYS